MQRLEGKRGTRGVERDKRRRKKDKERCNERHVSVNEDAINKAPWI